MNAKIDHEAYRDAARRRFDKAATVGPWAHVQPGDGGAWVELVAWISESEIRGGGKDAAHGEHATSAPNRDAGV